MGTEIERKFLVANDTWRATAVSAARLVQGYLTAEPGLTVRVRVADAAAWLTIKGATQGISRAEFEYPIPRTDADAMLATLALCPPVEKIRHHVPHAGHVWEVDVFAGANAGLVLAEIELAAVDEPFARPPWLGEEVSGDPRYYNARLARQPFRDW